MSATPPDIDCMLRALRHGANAPSEPSAEDIEAVNGFAAMARALYRERRRRERYFNAELFAEPAWDMLLDLRVHVAAKRPPSVSSACIGSASPASTGFRHLTALQEEGLIERSGDPTDGRRRLIRLSARGALQMDTYLAEVAIERASAMLR
ncbi:winged helix DNA-binding protein [Brevundimonas aurantiaca]|uniref:winged helix DNA-binding protein n=1 Tax=Brevundimonas aurantiaca TaxID=74316 RepID=UPI001CD4BFD3|nr:winged helix DNA-binding protein [Brevundimonas aurantiaca]